MVKVAELMGGVNVEEQMKDILEFEKKLAAVSWSQRFQTLFFFLSLLFAISV